MKRIQFGAVAMVLAPAAFCLWGCASSTGEPTVVPRVVDARADEQLTRMTSCLAGLDSFSFEADVRYDDYLVDSQKVQFGRRVAVDVQRPNRVHAMIDGDIKRMRYWYDGSRTVVLDIDNKQYSEAPAPPTIDDTLTEMAEKHGFVLPLAELIATESYRWLMNNVVSAAYVGERVIDGRRCHHLAYEQPTLDWQIWIDADEPALPRRLVISYKELPNCPQYEVAFKRWLPGAKFSENDFAVELPAGAIKIEYRMPDRTVGTKATGRK
jgi:hypothetical protein